MIKKTKQLFLVIIMCIPLFSFGQEQLLKKEKVSIRLYIENEVTNTFNPILIINKIDTLLLSKNELGFFVTTFEYNNFSRPDVATIIFNKKVASNNKNKPIENVSFLLDTTDIVLNYHEDNVDIIAGSDNRIQQEFDNIERTSRNQFSEITSNSNIKTVDSINIDMFRKELDVIRSNSRSYRSFLKTLSLMKPSAYPIHQELKEIKNILENDSFTTQEISYLNKKFKAFLEEYEKQKDKNHFPSIAPISSTVNNSFESLKNKYDYILIDFWATWCQPCREQHPIIDSLNNKYQIENKISVVGIAVSSRKEIWENYLLEAQLSYPNFLLDDLGSKDIIKKLNIVELPTYALLRTSDSKLVETYLSFDELERVLRKYSKN